MKMCTLVIASRNPGKIREIALVLRDLPLRLVSVSELCHAPAVEETGASIEENARLKAETIAEATGMPALADDSGLEVDILNGEPGVNSARYAGPDADDQANNQKLLAALAGVPAHLRGANFRCCIALAQPGKETRVVEEKCYGRIAEAPRGEGGFGYDPIFIYEPYGQTFAELAPEVKNSVSHRGKALQACRRMLMEMLEDVENDEDSNYW